MDRRKALKKLGVGGAIVATGPLVLDGFKVAHAASESDYPEAGDLSIGVIFVANRIFQVQLNSDVSPFAVSWAPVSSGLRIIGSSSTAAQFRSSSNVANNEFTVSLQLSAGGTTQAYNIRFRFSANPPGLDKPTPTFIEVTKGAFTP
mgnify:CR=1 FL=1